LTILKELFSCSLCLGFWSGLIVCAINHFTEQAVYMLLPLASSGACWVIDNINNTIQTVEIKLDKDLELRE